MNARKREILLLLLASLTAGCSDHLSPGTEMMLSEGGANAVSVNCMQNTQRQDCNCSKGTKVRVVSDPDEGKYRQTEILVLEGGCKDQNVTVPRSDLLPMGSIR